MTLESQVTKVVYEPDGVRKDFPIAFPFFNAGDVQAIYVVGDQETPLLAFTVEGFGTQNPFARFSVAPETGGRLVLRRQSKVKQETPYPEGGSFPSRVVERDFDKVVAILQEHAEMIARALKTDSAGFTLPDDFLRAFQAAVRESQEAAQTAQEAAGEILAIAPEALAGLDKLLGLQVQVEFIGADADPVGVYNEATGVLTIKLPSSAPGGGGGAVFSDKFDGTNKAENRVGASEWALAQAYKKAKDTEDALAGMPGLPVIGAGDEGKIVGVKNAAYVLKTLDTPLPGFNTIQTITTSGTFTAPVTGYYRVTVIGGGGAGGSGAGRGGKGGGSSFFGDIEAIGGGGGGGGSDGVTTGLGSGGGGGAGKVTIAFVYLTQGQAIATVIGAGGVIGTVNNTQPTGVGAGRNSSIGTGYGGGTGAAGAGSGSNGGFTSTGYLGAPGGSGGSNGTGYGGGGGGNGGSGDKLQGAGGTGADGGSDGSNGVANYAAASIPGGAGGNGAIIIEWGA